MDPAKFTRIIRKILAGITPEEAVALHLWSSRLLKLRTGTQSKTEKIKTIVQLTKQSPILFPLIKTIALELKQSGWDDTSWKSKLGMGAAAGAMLIITQAGAGLALLGGAIALPLWIVFGSGDHFVKELLQMMNNGS